MRDRIDEFVCCQTNSCDCAPDSSAELACYLDHKPGAFPKGGEHVPIQKSGRRFDGSVSVRESYECCVGEDRRGDISNG